MPALDTLTNLQELYLSNNQLSGDIPPSFTNLTSLTSLNLGYNKLTASDPDLLTWLDAHDNEWNTTQTVPPTNIQATEMSSGTGVELTWKPIPYTDDGGSYEISYATIEGGPYTVHGNTVNKSANSYVIDNLYISDTYYFVIRTYTPAHGDQQNELWSNYSAEVSATISGLPNFAITYGSTNKEYATSIRQTTDNGYIVAGRTESLGADDEDLWVLKLDSEGRVSWETRYGGTLQWYDDQNTSIQQTLDGGYILAGSDDFWVLKLDSEGNVSWEKQYRETSNSYARFVQQTPDGGYIVTGDLWENGIDFWVLKLNNNGEIIWEKSYGGDNADLAYALEQTHDGGYIVAGTTFSFEVGSSDMWVIKLDSDGNMAWQKTYGGPGDEGAYSIRQTTDDGYIIAGNMNSFGAGAMDFWVLKLDTDGEVLWQKTYGEAGADTAYAVEQTPDEGYLVAGVTHSFGAGSGDVWLLKLDSNGDVLWQKTYGGDGFDEALSMDLTVDEGYVLAGRTNSSGAGDDDMWVLKLDAHGNLPACDLGEESAASITDTPITGIDSDAVSLATNAAIVNTSVSPVPTSALSFSSCVNDPPIAVEDTYSVDEGATLTLGVLDNDTDPENAPLSAIKLSDPSHGTLILNADGSFTYIHDGSETLSDSLTYNANDGVLDSAPATVTIDITPINDAPIARDDSGHEYEVAEGGTFSLVAPGVLANDEDPEGDSLTATKLSEPSHGTLTFNTDGSFTYTHDGSETLSDSFSYKAHDGSLDSDPATVTITIIPINDAPIARDDGGHEYEVTEGGTLSLVAPGVLANDEDPEGNPLTALKLSEPSHGTLNFNADGSFTYTHDGSETLSDSFTYNANDGVLDSAPATVTITIIPINDPPIARDDGGYEYEVTEGGTLSLVAPGVLANDEDPEGNPLTAMKLSEPSHGTLTLNADGSFTYIHDGSETSSEDSFTYNAHDGSLDSAPATVTITITPIDDGPSIQIIEPDGIDDVADDVYTVTWIDDDPDSNAQIFLYYDPDIDNTNGNEERINPEFEPIYENDNGNQDSYNWNTSEVPDDDYYIYAEIDDGVNEPFGDYSDGLVTISHPFSTCQDVFGISPSECEALVALYNSTNGPNWSDSPDNGWKQTSAPCRWTGVTCSDGHVTEIRRGEKNLDGTIPQELNNLSYLEYLTLSRNTLTGEIPSLDTLSNLQYLSLYNNQLSGEISSLGNLANLSNLRTLYLYCNKLEGKIPAVNELINLEKLSFSNNQLSGDIPPSFTNLTSMTSLNLGYNKLTAPDDHPDLLAWLNTHDSNWYETQTVPPEMTGATPNSSTSVRVEWKCIDYIEDGGHYQVKYTTISDVTYTDASGITADKEVESYDVTGLDSGRTYYFVVETFTPAHGDYQQNDLTSDLSEEVSATTFSPEINVKQDSTDIPSGTGSYDFGTVNVGSSSAAITFTIQNTGNADLVLSGIQKIDDPLNDFTITQPFSSSVAPGDSTTFTIIFSPTATDERTAIVSIANNDDDDNEDPYTFTVTGTGQEQSPNSFILWTK